MTRNVSTMPFNVSTSSLCLSGGGVREFFGSLYCHLSSSHRKSETSIENIVFEFFEKHCYSVLTNYKKNKFAMLFLLLVTQVVLCVHARSYGNVFDVKKMIEKVDSKEYESFYNGEFATREIGEIEKNL